MENEKYSFLITPNRQVFYPTLVVMESVIEHCSKPCNFYILQDDWTNEQKQDVKDFVKSCGKNASVFVIDMNNDDFKFFRAFKQCYGIYYKLVAHMYIPEHVTKIMYLDTDMLIRQNIDKLFSIDITDKFFCSACAYSEYEKFVETYNSFSQRNNRQNSILLTSGMLLLNLKKFRDEKIDFDFFKSMVSSLKDAYFFDEGIMNYYFWDKTIYVPHYKYNFMLIRLEPYLKFRQKNTDRANHITDIYFDEYDPASEYSIIHFTAVDKTPKPWETLIVDNGTVLGIFKDFYAKDIARREIDKFYVEWWETARNLPEKHYIALLDVASKTITKALADLLILKNDLNLKNNVYNFYKSLVSDYLSDHKFELFMKRLKNKSIAILKAQDSTGEMMVKAANFFGVKVIFSSGKANLTNLTDEEFQKCKSADMIICCCVHGTKPIERDGIKPIMVWDILKAPSLSTSDYKEPAANNNEPVANNTEPVANNTEPAANNTSGVILTKSNLTLINDFSDYVFSLFTNAPDYVIFITSSDAHVSPHGNRKLEILRSLGLKTDFQKTFRHSFLAVVDGGEVKIEQTSPDKKLQVVYEFPNHKAEIISQGFTTMPVNSSPVSVKIDGFEYALSKRGLNFVIWDKKSNKVIDSVVFDTHANGQITRNNSNDREMLYKIYNILWELPVYSKTFMYLFKEKLSIYKMCLSPLYEYLHWNSVFLAKTAELIDEGITVLSFKHTSVAQLTNPSKWEKLCLSKPFGTEKVSNILDKYFEISGMSKIYSRDVFDEILKHPVQKVKEKNYYRHVEQTSEYVNVDSFGHRPTESFPESPYNTIYIFGDSIGDMWAMEDRHTLTNQLQELVKDKYRVINYSMGATRHYQAGQNMLDVDFETGDIVIFIWAWFNHATVEDDLKKIGVPIVDLLPYFERPRTNEVFYDWHHCNPNGYKIMADAMYEAIQNVQKDTTAQQLSAPTLMHNRNNLNSQKPDASPYFTELSPWLDKISNLRPKIGSIVMNCNPFTLGHRYLIEQSSAKVDKLFIFVVEEDKSIFPFADRIELVRKGTDDLPNITVLPSGKFIISSLTFTDYFEKSELQDRVIDPSMDVRIFGEHIAPTLGINVRFAGEEPLDNVTRQYNETMARILPKYGVSFEVIPRKELGGEVISASRVRKLLETKDFEAISRIVPETTLSYLMGK